jgi:hypothetical protein
MTFYAFSFLEEISYERDELSSREYCMTMVTVRSFYHHRLERVSVEVSHSRDDDSEKGRNNESREEGDEEKKDLHSMRDYRVFS